MNEQNLNGDERGFKVLLYLAIIVPIFSCTCAGLNLFIYGIPDINSVQLGVSQHMDITVMLIVVNGIVLAISGLLSNVIADWISEQIDHNQPSKKIIIAIIFILVFVVLISVEIFITILLTR